MGRPPCCDKSSVKRGLWSEEEDAKILAYVATHGTGNWTSVPKKAGLKRCGKSCRLRYTNYLRPDLKHESFTPQEEELIVNLHSAIGSRWSLIAGQLPGRTDNDVKNYWNTKLKKKLLEMGIDPVTHKPFSQILADYGNISGLPRAGTRFGSLNRDLRNAFMIKSETSQISQEGISNITSHSMMKPIQSNSFNNNNNTINNHPWQLLAQLQAIKLVAEASYCTNQEIIQPQFFSEGSSSSSSSASSCSSSSTAIQVTSLPPIPFQPSQVQATTTPSSPFSWSEFLLEDMFLPPDQQQQQQQQEERNFHGLSSTESSRQKQEMISKSEFTISGDQNKNVNENGEMGYGKFNCTGKGYPGMGSHEDSNVLGDSSSSDNSFVDAILDLDSEWGFPEILEEPFY